MVGSCRSRLRWPGTSASPPPGFGPSTMVGSSSSSQRNLGAAQAGLGDQCGARQKGTLMSSTFVGAAATGVNSGDHAGAVYGGLPTSMGSALNSGVHLASNEPINSTSMLNGSGDHNVELISQVCLNDLPALGVREPHQAATARICQRCHFQELTKQPCSLGTGSP